MTKHQSTDSSMPRRKFLKISAATVGGLGAAPAGELEAAEPMPKGSPIEARPISRREFNSPYTGTHLNQVAFPLGGIGAGMICLEGTGALSHLSLRNRPDVYNEPCVFA